MDILGAVDVRGLLRALGFDPGERRLAELGPPQKTKKLDQRGRTLKITTALLVQGSCGIGRPFGDAKNLAAYLAKGEDTKLPARGRCQVALRPVRVRAAPRHGAPALGLPPRRIDLLTQVSGLSSGSTTSRTISPTPEARARPAPASGAAGSSIGGGTDPEMSRGSYNGRELHFDVLSGEVAAPDDVKFKFAFLDPATATFPWIKFKDLVLTSSAPGAIGGLFWNARVRQDGNDFHSDVDPH